MSSRHVLPVGDNWWLVKDTFKLRLLLNDLPVFHENLFEICGQIVGIVATVLDKTVEKSAYLGGGGGAFFLNFVADRFFPRPLPLEAVLLGLQKKAGSLSICGKQL